jgi:excisionase family DNA binding protein
MPTNPQTTPTRDGSSADQGQPDALLTPGEVATLFRVNPKTVTRWARAGKLTAIRTLGGHRRFRASEIRNCLDRTEYQEEEA